MVTESTATPVASPPPGREARHEGVVSKHRSAPYRSGRRRGWRKVNTVSWREANRESGACLSPISDCMAGKHCLH